MIIKSALEAYAKASRHVFADRSGTVGASEVGACARRVFFTKKESDPAHGITRDPDHVDGWGAVTRGTIFEDHFWVPAMRARFGRKLLYAGDRAEDADVGMPERDAGWLGGQPATRHAGSVGCSRSRQDRRTGPRMQDRGSAQQTRRAEVRARLPSPGSNGAVSRADEAPAAVRAAVLCQRLVLGRSHRIRDSVRSEDLRARQAARRQYHPRAQLPGVEAGRIYRRRRECEHCPFTRACGRARMSVPFETNAKAEPEFVAGIAKLARQIKRAEQHVETATTKLRTLQNELRERMRAKGVRRVIGKDVRVGWSSVKGKPAFDVPRIREAAAAAGVDLKQFEIVGETSDRLEIRVTAQSRVVNLT